MNEPQNTKKAMPLTDEDFEDVARAQRLLQTAESKIHERMHEVLELYAIFFERELDSWWFEGASEGEVGQFSVCGDDIHLHIEWKDHKRNQHEKHNDQLFENYYSYQIFNPDLFDADESILVRLQEEVTELEEKAAKEKLAREKRKAHKEKVTQAAIEKLTVEERKALGIVK